MSNHEDCSRSINSRNLNKEQWIWPKVKDLPFFLKPSRAGQNQAQLNDHESGVYIHRLSPLILLLGCKSCFLGYLKFLSPVACSLTFCNLLESLAAITIRSVCDGGARSFPKPVPHFCSGYNTLCSKWVCWTFLGIVRLAIFKGEK